MGVEGEVGQNLKTKKLHLRKTAALFCLQKEPLRA